MYLFMFCNFFWWPNKVLFHPVGGRALVSFERHRLAVARETCLAQCSQKTTWITSRFPNLTFLGGGCGLLTNFDPFCFSFLFVFPDSLLTECAKKEKEKKQNTLMVNRTLMENQLSSEALLRNHSSSDSSLSIYTKR